MQGSETSPALPFAIGQARAPAFRRLRERCEDLRVPSAKLHDAKDRYKIKLRSVGYRLVYAVEDERMVVLVIAVGRRDRSEVYEIARKR